jgi:hypothetical protein
MNRKHLVRFLLYLLFLVTALPAAAAPTEEPAGIRIGPAVPGVVQPDTLSLTDSASQGYSALKFSESFLESDADGRNMYLQSRNRNWTIFAHYLYINPYPAEVMPRPGGSLPDLRAQITSLGASYHFASWDSTDFEVLAGTRYRIPDPGPYSALEPHTRIDYDDLWRHSYAGLRFFSRLSENWRFIGRGDVALSNGGETIGWNVAAMFDRSLGDWGSFYFGYKILALGDENVDTGLERYSYDALEQGPFIGLTIRF